MLPWLLDLAYVGLLVALTPLWIYRRIRLKKGLGDAGQRLWGNLPQRDYSKPCLWLHAVSVGEVVQLRPVLEALVEQHPDYEFVITTTTATGQEVARQRYPEHTVCYFPLDFSWAVARALDRIRPAGIVLVELELWPNFILAASRRKIPLTLINGRLTERSLKGYRWIRPFMRYLLAKVDLLAIQNETYAARFRELGGDQTRLELTGSIKFDRVATNRDNPQTRELRESFGLTSGERIWIAGSTQAPEERYAIESYLALRPQFPNLRLLLVPRHKERFDEVAELVESFRLPLVRRSALKKGISIAEQTGRPGGIGEPAVLLLDTLGELSACWGLAEIAFVGGSLGRRGGQNMIEPAGYGAAVLFGPNTHNFRDVVTLLLQEQAARVVADEQKLTACIAELLGNPDHARQLGERAQRLVLAQQGATQRTVALVREALRAA